MIRLIDGNVYTIEQKIDLTDLHDMLSDYFGLVLPNEFLVELLSSNINLLNEVVTGGITDTCARDDFILCITRKLGVVNWPTYGDGEKAFDEFFPIFAAAVEKIGGKVLTDEGAN